MSQYDNMTLFSNALITKKIHVNIQNIGSNIKQTLEKMIAAEIEGKCIVEGFVKNRSTKIMTYSSGLVQGSSVTFEVVYECSICSPVEGMTIHCIAKNITKAGIRAETNDSPSPVVIFVARDHHYTTPYFSDVKENEDIVVKVIGQRYELNDKYISIIAELVPKQLQLEAKAKHVKAKPVELKAKPVKAKPVEFKAKVVKANPVEIKVQEPKVKEVTAVTQADTAVTQVDTAVTQVVSAVTQAVSAVTQAVSDVTQPVSDLTQPVSTKPVSTKPVQVKRKPRLILED